MHPTDFSRTLFPGQDYNNARILDFQDVPDYISNGLSALESARMPWHDVHMTLAGAAVRDIVQHFVERWNEIKKRKVGSCAPIMMEVLSTDISTDTHGSTAKTGKFHIAFVPE